MLRKFYLSEGYADFRVVSAVAELTPDRDGFVVTFTIDEGERYHFGKIDVDIKLKDLPHDAVLPLLTVQSGDWYDADAVEHSIAVLTDALGNRGYAFVEVKPKITRNREDRTIDITFDVQEGPQVYVERIDIVGNVRTLDKVIRREFRLVEGDAFNTNKMQRSKERIKNLGFFKKVEVTNSAGLGARSRRWSRSRSRSSRPANCRSASASRRPTVRSPTSASASAIFSAAARICASAPWCRCARSRSI